MRTPEEHAVAAAIIQLMRGVVYHEHDEATWITLDRNAPAVRDQFAAIGVDVIVDDTEGYAYLQSRRSTRTWSRIAWANGSDSNKNASTGAGQPSDYRPDRCRTDRRVSHDLAYVDTRLCQADAITQRRRPTALSDDQVELPPGLLGRPRLPPGSGVRNRIPAV